MTDWKNLNHHHIPSEIGLLAIKLDRAGETVEELSGQRDLKLADPRYVNNLAMALNRYALLIDEWLAALQHFQGNNP